MLYDKKWDKQIETKTEPWRQVLRDAAAKIERFGWFQVCEGVRFEGGRTGEERHRCAITAVKPHDEISEYAWRQFCKFVGMDGVAFNNTPGRTKEEVMAAIRACAES